MRKFFKRLFNIGLYLFTGIYALSCLTKWIPPAKFSVMGLLGLGFPYLFLLMCVLLLIAWIGRWKSKWIFSVVWALGIYNVSQIFAFNTRTWHDAKDSSAFRVMSWNAKGFTSDQVNSDTAGNACLNVIKKYDPDILCIQEYCTGMMYDSVWSKSIDRLDSLGYRGVQLALDSVLWDGKPMVINTGVAIFCKKYVLLEKSSSIFVENNRSQGYASADIVIKHRPLRIKTARFASYGLYSDTTNYNKSIYEITYERKRQVQNQLRHTEQVHESQASFVRKAIDYSPIPVLFCGDLNAVPTSYNYMLLKGHDLQDAFLQGGWGIGATFYNIVPTLRIDVCLASKELEVLQAKIIHEKISDHYPIVADMRWRNK